MIVASLAIHIISVLAWPVVALIAVLLAAFSWRGKLLISWVRDHLKSVEAFGIKVELTKEAATETRINATEAFSVLRDRLRSAFDGSARNHEVRQRLEQIVRNILPIIGQNSSEASSRASRWTVYVEDGLFDGRLYQLVDYYPSGSGRGRDYSERFGIVGKAWRSKSPAITGSVPTGEDGVRELIGSWGMTEEEARKVGNGKTSFLAFPLRSATGVQAGVLYADAPGEDVFGSSEDSDWGRAILDRLGEEIARTELVASVIAVKQDVGPVSPRLGAA